MQAAFHEAPEGDVVHPRWFVSRVAGIVLLVYVAGCIFIGGIPVIILVMKGASVAQPLLGPVGAVIGAAAIAVPLAFVACMAVLFALHPLLKCLMRVANGRCPRCRAFTIEDDAVFTEGLSYAHCTHCDLHMADVGPGRAWREVGDLEWAQLHRDD